MTAKLWAELTYNQQQQALAITGYAADSLTRLACTYTLDRATASVMSYAHMDDPRTWDQLTDSEQARAKSLILDEEDDCQSWLYNIGGGAVVRLPRIREAGEIAELERQWAADPQWPLADTPGFWHHDAELAKYETDMYAQWDAARRDREEAEARRSLVFKLLDEKVDSLTRALGELQRLLVAKVDETQDLQWRVRQLEYNVQIISTQLVAEQAVRMELQDRVDGIEDLLNGTDDSALDAQYRVVEPGDECSICSQPLQQQVEVLNAA